MNHAEQTPASMSGGEASTAAPSSCRFGAWLKQQRKARQLTQEDLAERLACSSALVYKIEAEERTPSGQLAALIADWLEIPDIERSAFLSFARGGLKLDARQAEARFGYGSAVRTISAASLPMPLTPLIGFRRRGRSLNTTFRHGTNMQRR